MIAHPDACLFHGAPAVAFTLRTADHPAYAAALATIDSHIATLTRHRLDRAHERIDRAQMPQLREFDLINGLTGIGVYLLQAGNTDLLRDVLDYLLRLTEPITIDGQTLPGWWTGNGPADQPQPLWPGGHANLGLAHGIAGPLALLASAMIHGITVPGHAEAIDRIDAALGRWRCGTRRAPWWPGTISAAEWKTGAIAQPGPQRPSWCYGTPGLARARQLAACALDDLPRQRRAETALASCIADDTQLAQLRDDSLCHGWAGLVHTTRQAAADAGPGSQLGALLPGLWARWEQHQQPGCPRLSHQDGMLEGAAGIALTHHTLHTPDLGELPAARWDACLLITPATPQTTPHPVRNQMISPTSTQPEDLRERMVEHIRTAGHLHTGRIEQALRTVPRHLFVPAASVEDAYANKAITIKPGPDRPASCASVPTVVAMMLGQLGPQPGDRVLEIGAGTGYNAALLAELVGETGQVTTIDIHPDVTAQARHALDETGYSRVQVITGDGALGHPDHAPYNKIIVTVGPWDLPPAWFDQLTPGGRLVVPLHWRGQARSIAFTRTDTALRAEDRQLCGFIPMIGIVPAEEQTGQIATTVALHWDSDQTIDPAALRDVFTRPETTVWSGATVAAEEPFDRIWLRLTGTEPGTCRLAAEPAAIEAGLCRPAFAHRTPALVDGDSLAYLTKPRPVDHHGQRRYELGATGHGPAAAHLAERLCQHIRDWDHDRTAQPTITAHPASENVPDSRVIIAKQHVHIVVTH